MDKLEKFIKENSDSFNEHKADKAKMWKTIATELEQPKTKVIPLWRKLPFQIAASLLILLGVFSIYNFNAKKTPVNYANKELRQIDSYYQNIVETQVELVKKDKHLSAKNKEEFLKFMVELDKEDAALKVDLADNLDNQQVLSAIIKNYKKRIELIENLLNQINESKKDTHENEYVL